jgi:hypothetical protein
VLYNCLRQLIRATPPIHGDRHEYRVDGSNNVRDTAKDAREAVREVGKAASAASGDLQSDLQALRDDFGRLAEQVGDILANKGNAAWRRAKSSIDDASFPTPRTKAARRRRRARRVR